MSDNKIIPSAALRGAGDVAADNLRVQRDVLTIKTHGTTATELDMESLARAAWEAYDPNTPWEEAFPDQKASFRDIASGARADIERQGFQITRMVKITGRVNDGEKPQGAA